MAEGCEETESSSSNVESPAMLGTVIPCEAITAALGGMKRELDISNTGGIGGAGGGGSSGLSYPELPLTPAQQNQHQQQPPILLGSIESMTPGDSSTSIEIMAAPKTMPVISAAASAITTKTKPSTAASPSIDHIIERKSSPDQNHRIILKAERDDSSSSISHNFATTTTTTTAAAATESDEKTDQRLQFYKNFSYNSSSRSSPQDIVVADRKKPDVAAATAVQAHLNGTMQDILNLQKLQQNLTSLQHDKYQMHQSCSSNSNTLSDLHQELTGTSAAIALNSPLNLSVGSSSTSSLKPKTSLSLDANDDKNLIGCNSPCETQMPQFILASGQIIEGVQGAQLLIPTSQGISVQTVLTIPVSQQINANDQFVQANSADSLDFNNLNFAGQHQHQHQHQHHLHHQQQQMSHNQKANLVKPNLFSIGVQKLLAALHPQFFPPDETQQTDDDSSPVHHRPKSNSSTSFMKITKPDENNTIINHQSNNSISPKLDLQSIRQRIEPPPTNLTLSPTSFHNRGGGSGGPTGSGPGNSSGSGGNCTGSGNQNDEESPKHTKSYRRNSFHEKPASTSTSPICSIAGAYPQSAETGQVFQSHSSPNDYMNAASSVSSSSCHINSTSSTSLLNSINRLTNGELTITKSLGYPNHTITGESATSTSPKSIHPYNHHTAIKLSPTYIKQNSPPRTESTDLQLDSPNELTINQTNCNVVEGINLNEIKEFAKAFKLRRLSLGLTQTQVGQALSVTEGPAYSQSAICSALAAQMYAAQLSSQQQNMFEKLDITPKSAQKIKPVLERWMKEAEESHWNRFKTGQSHLTDFIGVEPSKKRKRRTSFTPQALELLNAHFERNTHPSGTEITGLAHQLGYEREVIRIWFCNKRQALKNTVRMMSKGMA